MTSEIRRSEGKAKREEGRHLNQWVIYNSEKGRKHLPVPLTTNLLHASFCSHSSSFSSVINLSAFNPSPAYPAVPSNFQRMGPKFFQTLPTYSLVKRPIYSVLNSCTFFTQLNPCRDALTEIARKYKRTVLPFLFSSKWRTLTMGLCLRYKPCFMQDAEISLKWQTKTGSLLLCPLGSEKLLYNILITPKFFSEIESSLPKNFILALSSIKARSQYV